MQPAPEDAFILRRSVDRPDEFAQLYRRHVSVVLRYVGARLGPDAAEDATHEVFLHAFRQRARYEARFATALPWLYGIAVNVIADHRRQERRRLRTLEQQSRSRPETEASPLDHGVRGIDPALMAALIDLPLVDREALLLWVWGELSYDEIAGAAGVPIGTVRSRISRARTRLLANTTLPSPSLTSNPTTGETHA